MRFINRHNVSSRMAAFGRVQTTSPIPFTSFLQQHLIALHNQEAPVFKHAIVCFPVCEFVTLERARSHAVCAQTMFCLPSERNAFSSLLTGPNVRHVITSHIAFRTIDRYFDNE